MMTNVTVSYLKQLFYSRYELDSIWFLQWESLQIPSYYRALNCLLFKTFKLPFKFSALPDQDYKQYIIHVIKKNEKASQQILILLFSGT